MVHAILSYGVSAGLTTGGIPGLLTDVIAGDTTAIETAVSRLVRWDQPFCMGYLVKCLPRQRVSLGAYYSLLCSDLATSSQPAVRDDGAVARAYGNSPYWSLCEVWPVSPEHAAADVGTTDVATFVVLGRYGPHSPAARVREDFRQSSATLIEVEAAHNVMSSSECLLDYRDRWLADQTTPPPSCLDETEIEWEVP